MHAGVIFNLDYNYYHDCDQNCNALISVLKVTI